MSSSNGPGPPLLSLSLTALPSPNVDDGARSRLWMCPLDMHEARLRSGATVALALDSASATNAATASGRRANVERRGTAVPLSPSSSPSSSAPLPGSSIVLADAWPGPKLPRGRASPSRALAASLGLLRRHDGSGNRGFGGGHTTDGVAVSLLAPPPGADGDDGHEAAELVLRPLQLQREEGVEEADEDLLPGPRQLAALSALAARRAAGRRLLRGNVLAVPLLGRDAPFEVARVLVVAGDAGSRSRSLLGWEAAKVGPRTKVRVVAAGKGGSGGGNVGDDDDDDDDDDDGGENSSSDSESGSEDEDAAAASPSSSYVLLHGGDPYVAAAAAAAAKAAEAAVGGGPSGPAASAATAAAAAGARALRAALSRARAVAAAAASSPGGESGRGTGGFAPLGGVGALSERLRGLAVLPLCRPGAFSAFGLRAPAGAVLHGPPGTGKTALAVAVAADAALALREKKKKEKERKEEDTKKKSGDIEEEQEEVSLFVVGGAEVVRSAAGASEAGLRGVFAAARASPGPAVVFLDEVDALAPARGRTPGGGGGGGGGGGSSGSGGSGAVAPAAAAAAASGASARLSTALAAELDLISSSSGSSKSNRIVVLAATNRLEAVDQSLRRPGRLDAEVEVPPPGPEARAAILRSYLCAAPPISESSKGSPALSPGMLRRHSLTDRDVRRLADAAHGFVGADLALLAREAAGLALRRAVRNNASSAGSAAVDPDCPDLVVTREDFDAARRVVRPSAMRSVALRLPRARWGDVGGQRAAKARLQEALATAATRSSSGTPSSSPSPSASAVVPKNPALLGVAPPAGILLFGPPGCSKTLLARAAARESGRNLFAVKAGELLSCYVGDSERAVASLFRAAKAASPSLVFFDEIDGLAPRREEEGADGRSASSTNEASARVVAQLLLELDAVAALADRSAFSSSSSSSEGSGSSSPSADAAAGVAPVVVVAATNRPDRVDPALLRPGRLERRIHVGPPVDSAEREEVLRAAARRCPLGADVELGAVAEATGGFTGADLAALVRSAATLAAEEGEDGAESVCARHFEEALRTARPSRRAGGGGGENGAGGGGGGEEAERVYASFSRPGLG